MKLFDTIGRMDLLKGPLTNLTDGGEHCVHWNDLSKEKQEEVKIKRSIRMKENNIMFDKEIAKKNGYARRGQIRSEEWKEEMSNKIKLSDNHKNAVTSEKWIENQKLKHFKYIIKQFDDDMTLINIFYGLNSASFLTHLSKNKFVSMKLDENVEINGIIFRKEIN